MQPKGLHLQTRRHFFQQAGFGIGSLALGSLLNDTLFGQPPVKPIPAKPPHFAPKAKRIIYLFMAGAPSQLDMFDYKPALIKYNGQPLPEDRLKVERLASINGTPTRRASPHAFARHGQLGAEL